MNNYVIVSILSDNFFFDFPDISFLTYYYKDIILCIIRAFSFILLENGSKCEKFEIIIHRLFPLSLQYSDVDIARLTINCLGNIAVKINPPNAKVCDKIIRIIRI